MVHAVWPAVESALTPVVAPVRDVVQRVLSPLGGALTGPVGSILSPLLGPLLGPRSGLVVPAELGTVRAPPGAPNAPVSSQAAPRGSVVPAGIAVGSAGPGSPWGTAGAATGTAAGSGMSGARLPHADSTPPSASDPVGPAPAAPPGPDAGDGWISTVTMHILLLGLLLTGLAPFLLGRVRPAARPLLRPTLLPSLVEQPG